MAHPNPVIAAVDAGHYTISRQDPPRRGQPGLTVDYCRADDQLWPCDTIRTAQKAARIRGDELSRVAHLAKRDRLVQTASR